MKFNVKALKAERLSRGLSLVDFAELVGVSKLTVFNWEHGLYSPNTVNIKKLAKATDRPISYYMTGVQD